MCESVLRIRIDLNTDPDPAFKAKTDPDSDPGIFLTKMKEFFFLPKTITFFQSLIALYTLIEYFQAQV